MFDLVEEALDEIARLVEMLREANRFFAVGLGRNVRPGASLGDGIAQSVSVVAFVGQKHGVPGQVRNQLLRASDVALLAGGQFELERSALLVDDRVDFCCEAASGATQTSIVASIFRPLFAVAPC